MISDNLHGTIYGASWVDDVPEVLNSPPIVVDQLVSVFEDGQLTIPFNGTDANGDSLTYEIIHSPLFGDIEMVSLTGFLPPLQ